MVALSIVDKVTNRLSRHLLVEGGNVNGRANARDNSVKRLISLQSTTRSIRHEHSFLQRVKTRTMVDEMKIGKRRTVVSTIITSTEYVFEKAKRTRLLLLAVFAG